MPNEDGLYTKEEVQSMIRERLASKDQELSAVKRERDEASRKVLDADARIERAEKVAVDAAFQVSGIPGDATIRRGFEVMYREAAEGKDDPPSLAEWLTSDEAKAHPMLSAHYSSPGETPATTTEPPAPPADPPAPPADPPATTTEPPAVTPPPTGDQTAQPPPVTSGKMDPQQLAAYFQSPEYRAMPREERAAKRTELQSQYGAGEMFGATPRVVVNPLTPGKPPGS